MKSCLWEGPLSLRAPKCLQHSRNAGRGSLCEQSSQPGGWRVQIRRLPPPGILIRGLELVCPSLFSNRKREEVTRRDKASISSQHRAALPAMARGQRSICQSKPLKELSMGGQLGPGGQGETGVGSSSPGAADCFLLPHRSHACAVDNSWPEPTVQAEYGPKLDQSESLLCDIAVGLRFGISGMERKCWGLSLRERKTGL